MIWHDEQRIKDGKLRHPANSLAWERVDKIWSKIDDDPRNLRFGLSANGKNPHSSLSSKYSNWPIILTIYNFPLWLCMKETRLYRYYLNDLGHIMGEVFNVELFLYYFIYANA